MKREYMYPYIMLDPEGMVQNIAMFSSYEQANQITRACYGDGAYAEAYRYAVQPGDKHINGVFYVVEEDGSLTEAEYIPNDEDNISYLKDENVTLTTELTDTQLALVEQYEENMALQEEVTNTQLALCEVYELMEA